MSQNTVNRMKRLRKSMLLMASALLGSAMGGVYLYGDFPGLWETQAKAAPAPGVSLLPVKALSVQLENGYEVEERYAGRVVSRRRSDLGFERPGLLVEVNVDEGSNVEKGEVLARLDRRRLEAKYRELQAKLEHSRATYQEIAARLELAEITLQRFEKQWKSNSISRQNYDEAVFDKKALSAQLSAAAAAVREVEAGIQSLEVDMDLSALHAPYTGSIVIRLADEGAAIEPGQPILQIIEDGILEVRVGVPVHTAGSLTPGETYPIEVDGQTYPARLKTLLARLDPQTRTVPALFLLDKPDGELRAGQLARLSLTRWIAGRGFWLPITALAESYRGLWSAYALKPTDHGGDVRRVTRHELQMLHSESERAFVRGTLRDGEQVVTSGLHRLVPDQLVRITSDTAIQLSVRE